MSPLKRLVFAGIAMVGTPYMTAAFAADMPRISSVPALGDPIPNTSEEQRFYLRGDVGIGMQRLSGFSQLDLANNGGSFLTKKLGDTTYLSVGFGVKLNSWFRADVTGEYRSKANVRAFDNVSLSNPAGTLSLQSNTNYTGDYSAVVGLVNGYFDLGNWRGFTPYFGAGVGVAYNRMSGFTETSIGSWTTPSSVTTVPTSGTLGSKSTTKFAWALMAGTTYDLSPSAKLDIGYRYLNLGSGVSATTGLIDCICGTIGQPLKARNIHSNEIRIGIRWLLEPEAQPRPMMIAPTPIVARY